MEKKLLKEKIGEIIGEASMCWKETPTSVFDSDKASLLIDRMMNLIFGEPKTVDDHSEDECFCKHIRKQHGKSTSINYTEGMCGECDCRNFIMGVDKPKQI